MSNKQYPRLMVVDDNDQIIGYEYYADAIKKGLLRRTAGVYVFNESGKVLLQKRSKEISNPLVYDISAGGHVDEGSNNLETATKELEEELGVTDVRLQEISSSFQSPEYYASIYKVVVPDKIKINFDEHEVDSVYWCDVLEVDAMVEKYPDRFTHIFILTWTQLRDKLI